MSENVHVVCPSCGAINRAPPERMAQARCGTCHKPLFEGHAVAVDEAGFERHVSRSDLPVLADMWGTWCPSCRVLAPHFEHAAAALEPRVRLVKLEVDKAPATSERLGIHAIPTMILFERGKEVARLVAVRTTDAIVRWVQDTLAAEHRG
ncbi:MAG: thiol reductase thioredoxin [Rhodospirillales bacterium]|nr:thiol reductase thioredoxin [Rhodospirillales bacterium]